MYAYPQHLPHFYENQRHWEEPHHPLSPNHCEMYNDSDYYYPDPSSSSKRHGHYDTSRRRKSGTLDDYPPTSNRYPDTYYPSQDYYYYESAEEEPNDIYYYHQHHYPHPHHRHGARSASPSKRKDRKRQHARLAHKSSFKKNEAWTQPTPFVNPQPMIMDPMMSLQQQQQQQQQQILGTCTTDAIMPVIPNNFGLMPQAPMINPPQPYFMPLPSASANYPPFAFQHQQALLPFVQPMPHPPLFSDLFTALSIQDTNKPVTSQVDQAEATSAHQEPPPAQQEHQQQQQQQPKTAPSTPMTRPTQRPLQRRRSMMETVLSSFSLLGNNQSSTNIAHKSWDPSSYVSLDQALKLGTSHTDDTDAKNESAISSSLSPRSVASASSAVAPSTTTQQEEGASATLSRRDSLKLSQKMSVLQSRHYIWCYKPQNEEAALWAAFDVKNQRKLDHHYAKLTSKKQQMIQQQQQQQKESDKDAATVAAADAATTSFLPDDVITLSKQSQLHGPVIVSLNKATAWCFDNDSSFSFGSSGQKHVLLDIACLPSHQNRFVVSNQLVSKDPVVRRSKSVDGGLANKFINSVLKW